jgi:mitogen-activated protein kinase organizer 1
MYPLKPSQIVKKVDLTLDHDLQVDLEANQDGEVYSVRYNKTGEYLMSGHADRVVRLWNAQKGVFVSAFEGAHNREIFDIVISEDNEKFVTCGGDKLVYLWEVLKGRWVRKFEGHTQSVNSVHLNEY